MESSFHPPVYMLILTLVTGRDICWRLATVRRLAMEESNRHDCSWLKA